MHRIGTNYGTDDWPHLVTCQPFSATDLHTPLLNLTVYPLASFYMAGKSKLLENNCIFIPRISVEQVELSSLPFDSISQVRFSPTHPDHLLVSAWDTVSLLGSSRFFGNISINYQTVRFYDVAANEQKAKFDHRAAVLSCLFGDSTHAYSGCLDTGVRECVNLSLLSEKNTLISRIGLISQQKK